MSTVGRVCRASRGIYHVLAAGAVQQTVAAGRLLHDGAGPPVVGDWVRFCGGRIEAIEPRRTALRRKRPGKGVESQVLAANVDAAFVVTGLDANFNLRRIERYAVMVEASGVRPVVVLNKADCCANPWERAAQAGRVSAGAPVVLVSALEGTGFEELLATITAGETAVLLGSSGAGKSTITNRLLGREIQRTEAVCEGDDRGRHTTTGRELFETPDGWFVIDTPGLRELQPWTDGDALAGSFADVAELAENCRFRDCSHQAEPGCAVARAVAEGTLDARRLESFWKLEREARLLEAKTDVNLAREEKARVKKFHKLCRSVLKQGRR